MARRSGGRAARVALREAPPTAEARPVWPGMPGGAYRPLSDGQCDDIFEAALGLLADLGMGQAIPEIIEAVTANGGRMDEHDRLRIPPDLVRRVIDGACKEFTLHGFDPDRGVEIGGNRVHFCTSGAAVLMFDHDTRSFRPSAVADLYSAARVADTLDNIHVFVRTVVTRDMETAREVDINTAYACMAGTSKPIGTSMFHPDHVGEVVDLFDMALGGEGEFARRPFCIANNTFVVPPLRYAEESAMSLMEQARRGMPINLLSAGQAGATSPAALAGSLVQALAECLAGLVAVNLVVPGHPCVMGMWPFVSDLRTGAMSGGSGEEAVINASAAQVVNYLGLPSGVAAGMADSKLPDNQAGHEKANAITLAANAGANMINESAGMLASIMACSLEAMVIDNDMLGSINRTVRGVEVTPETLSTQVIADVVRGEGHFLGHSQTLSLMQTEYVYPLVGDRLSPDDWTDAGARPMVDVAHDYVTEVLDDPKPAHLNPEADAQIRATFPIHLDPIR